MTFRGARRRKAIDKGFVLSDHCDWDGLLESIEATGCENVITTHGYQEIFARFLREEKGLNAISERTQYEGENSELETEEKNQIEEIDPDADNNIAEQPISTGQSKENSSSNSSSSSTSFTAS